MNPHRRRGVWSAIAVAATGLVLGVATTALMAAPGAFPRTAPASWKAQSPRCGAPAAKATASMWPYEIWDA
ncbi:hypothetical protein S1361_36955 [Streptomyces cyanogenus]|uniref:Uncharacterized protein n=1 Tax=Streptomyces cyanogenus TaxID=80860 RepID=A0ABX7U1S3_STRCY|nr:hypothetical protein S1361_36955 [Streptomyces cyanogenus]